MAEAARARDFLRKLHAFLMQRCPGGADTGVVTHSRMLIMLAISAAPYVAAAEDSTAEPAKPAITLAGYVETYYQLNLRSPSNQITNLRGYDQRDRTFTLSNAVVDVKGERGPLTSRVILQVGSTGSAYYLAEPARPGAGGVDATGPAVWKYLQQASIAYTTTGKLVIDAGLFPSPIGPEVIPVKDNWNWSRSDLFFALPAYHTGVRAAVPLGHGWTGMVHAYNGWNSVVDNNPYPSVALSAAYAGKRVSGQLLYFGGIERTAGSAEGNAWRHLVDAYATVAISDRASVLVHADAGIEPNHLGRSGWAAGAVAAKVQLTPTLYAAARADYFREWVANDRGATAAPMFWPTPWIGSGTVTVAHQPVDGVSIRLELRHDHAKTPVFFGGDVAGDGVATPFVPNRRAQDTVTLGATAWF